MVGRKRELARIESLLDRARRGEGGCLVLHGPAGIGKSALISEPANRAGDMTGARARGAEWESSLAYSGLASLVAG